MLEGVVRTLPVDRARTVTLDTDKYRDTEEPLLFRRFFFFFLSRLSSVPIFVCYVSSFLFSIWLYNLSIII